jgi:hypothetical protein
VLFNLEKFIDNDAAIPAQIVVTSGAASTTNSVTPSIAAPLGSQITSVAGKATQFLKNPASLTVNASDTWSQNWGFAPITDAFQMRRLSALYRFAIDGDSAAFVRRYPPLYKSVTITRPECLHDAQGAVRLTVQPAQTPGTSGAERKASLCATSTGQGGALQVTAATLSANELIVDDHYLQGPACIVCLRHGRRVPNENLRAGWLRWVNLAGASNHDERPPLPGDRTLGVYGHHELFVAQGQGEKLAEFTMFVLAASTQTDATNSSNNSFSQGGGGRGANRPGTQSLITPQGEVVPVVPSN